MALIRADCSSRSEGRVPNGIFDPWVRWDGGLDSARNSSAVAVAAAAVVGATSRRRHLSAPPPLGAATSAAVGGPRPIRTS